MTVDGLVCYVGVCADNKKKLISRCGKTPLISFLQLFIRHTTTTTKKKSSERYGTIWKCL